MNLKRTTKVREGEVGPFHFFRRTRLLSPLGKVSFSSVESGLLFIGGAAIFFTMCLVSAEVIGRYFFRRPITGHLEITELFLIVIIYLSVAATEKAGIHISMNIIPELLKRKGKLFAHHALSVFNFSVPLCAFAFACYVFAGDTYTSYLTNEASWGPMYLKYWPFKVIITIGFAFLVLRLGIEIIAHVKEITVAWRSLKSNG